MASTKLYEHSLGEVPRKLHHLYMLDAERGGYRLVCDHDEQVAGLKSALKKQRDDNKTLRHKYGLAPESEATIPIGDIRFVKGDDSVPDVRAESSPNKGPTA